MKTALFTTAFAVALLTGLIFLTGLAVVALYSPATSITFELPEPDAGTSAEPQSESEPDQVQATAPAVTVEFTLVTVAVDGKLAFRGQGGSIDGLINPDLHVRPGDAVHITLINGDGMPHDLFLPDFNVKTDYVAGFGDQAELTFEAGEALGDFVYYCTLPGHRAAGQEGLLVIDLQPR